MLFTKDYDKEARELAIYRALNESGLETYRYKIVLQNLEKEQIADFILSHCCGIIERHGWSNYKKDYNRKCFLDLIDYSQKLKVTMREGLSKMIQVVILDSQDSMYVTNSSEETVKITDELQKRGFKLVHRYQNTSGNWLNVLQMVVTGVKND